jgi:hypothetical protein
MTDPERISLRAVGLSAELLRAGSAEQPSAASVEQTLVALGVSGVVLTSASIASGVKLSGLASTSSATASAAGGSALAAGTGGAVVKVASTALLLKWIGIGALGGVGLAGVAAVATRPSRAPALPNPPALMAASPASKAPFATPQQLAGGQAPSDEAPSDQLAPTEAPSTARAAQLPPAPAALSEHALSGSPERRAPAFEVGTPLAAEVAFVDHARALLAAGQTEVGLAELQTYEQKFPEARLLPEVLFLRLEASQRAGHPAAARAAAQRLVEGFPQSPHAARARLLLRE